MAQKTLKLFFDFDGTLLDIAPRHYRVYEELVHELHGQPLDQQTYWSQKRHKAQWVDILSMSQLSAAVEPVFLERFIAKIEDPEYLKSDTLFEGVATMLRQLKADGYSTYLVSLRRHPERLQTQLEHLSIYQNFIAVLSGHAEDSNPYIKVGLMQPILKKDRGVIIGDTEADILAGKELDMTTIAVLSGIRDRHTLAKTKPDYLLDYASQSLTILNDL